MRAVFKKELRIYFTSILGYVVMTIYLLFAALFFYGMYIRESGNSDFSGFFGVMNSVFMLVIPFITMRILAEEKRDKTFELLMTSPTDSWGIILGKFLGALVFVGTAASLLLLYPLFLSFFAAVDWGTVISSYLGMIFSLVFFIGVGMAASSLTDSNVIAGMITFGAYFIVFLISAFRDVSSDFISGLLTEISYAYHFEQFSRGIIKVKNILYFIIGAFVFLYFAKDRIESKTWK